MHEAKGVSLHTRILLALILGVLAGLAANLLLPRQNDGTFPPLFEGIIEYVADPVGQIFLRLLKLTVVPLVFSSLALGVAQLGSQGNLGRIAIKTFAFFLITMSVAVVIGLTMVNTIRPGESISKTTQDELEARYKKDIEKAQKKSQDNPFGIHTFIGIVPENPVTAMAANPPEMLAVIFFALLIGLGLTRIHPDRSKAIMIALEGLNDLMVLIIGWAMLLAPFGVFALIFKTTSLFGLELFKAVVWYALIVIVGIALQMFGVLPVLLVALARVNPIAFYKKIRQIVLTAFSTCSSSATLPTSISVSEKELGVPPPIAGFVLPLGATMNMNGTALFEGVTVVFLAQVFGKDLSVLQQLIVLVMSVLTAIGAAGVPGGSLPLLATVLAMFGVSADGLALILGIDRILDMCRTTLNVVGDVAAAAYVTRSEGYPLLLDGGDLPVNPTPQP
jgi:DAACS family dicarboxylate/amino acid:cation (Na+ or H+) symporter